MFYKRNENNNSKTLKSIFLIVFLFFSLLIPLLSLSQTPSETFDEVARTVFNSISDGEWKVEKSLGKTNVNLSWTGEFLQDRYSQEFKDGKRKMGFWYHYPKMKKNKSFRYIVEPILYKYSLPNIDNSYFIWNDKITNYKFNYPQEYRIGNKSYIKYNTALFYEEGFKYYNNDETGEGRQGSLSSARSNVFKFCNNMDCTIYLEMNNRIDPDDVEQVIIFNQTRPLLFDLDIYNSKIKNTDSNQDIIVSIVDTDDIFKNYALENNISSQELHKEDTAKGYKVVFESGSNPLAKHQNIDNINFSINKDFEFSFNSSKTIGHKADHKVLIALGYSGSELDPNPEAGSKNYHLKFILEQTTAFKVIRRDIVYRKADQTFLTVEKYLNGLRIQNDKLNLKKNYLYDREKGQTKINFKINRIDNDIYLSVDGDVLYIGEIGRFQNNKIIVDHKDLGPEDRLSFFTDFKYNSSKSRYHNSSRIEDIVFSNPLESNKNINKTTPSEWLGNGSGFFISDKGYIATNFHVVENAEEIEISFNDGVKLRSFSAELSVSDPSNDLAILKINSSDFSLSKNIPYTIKMRSSDIGSEVFALGFPMALSGMGEDIKFTDGKISSKSGFNGDLRLYQTTTPIQPGNSGGPLFDYNGNLIAINSAKISSDKADNVSYSIKSSYLINLMDGLPENINFPNNNVLSEKPLTELIKELSKYVVLIKVK